MAENNGPLSDRELEVMRLVALGQTNQEIGRVLDISPNTVKVHLRNIFEKLGVASRTEATLVVIREGWVKVEGVASADEHATAESAPGTPEEAADSVLTLEAEKLTMVRQQGARSTLFWMVGALALVLVVAVAVAGWQLTRRPQTSLAGSEISTPPERWSTMPALPEARMAAAAVTYAGQLFVVGGRSRAAPVASVAIYEPEREQWRLGAAKPLPVSEARAAVLGGQLVVPGGLLANGVPTDEVEVYTPQDDRWTSVAPLPRPLARYALAAYEGRLYLFGGWDGQQVRDEILRYDPERDTWEQVARLDAPRAAAAAAELNDVLYIVGGSDENETPLADVVLFLPRPEPTLEAGPPLPEPEPAPALTTLAGNLYLLGQTEQLRYDPVEHAWTRLETPPVANWLGIALAALDPYIIVLGGSISGEPSAAAWRYQAIYHVFIPGAPAPEQP